MRIIYRLGDMFASDCRILVHGCNARGSMGAGVAALVRTLHPLAYAAYRAAFETRGLHLGEVIWAASNDKMIGNAITQDRYGRDPNIVYCDYDAIRSAMRAVNEAVQPADTMVGMPQIGAGLANGDWSVIAGIIEEEATRFTPVVFVIDPAIHQRLTAAGPA